MTSSLKINGREVEAPITRGVLLATLYIYGPLMLALVFLVILAVLLLVSPLLAVAALVDVSRRAFGGRR